MPEATSESTTENAPPSGTRALRALVVDRVLPGRNRTKADVLLGTVAGLDVAVKDYRPRPAWIRATLGRWLVRREARAYRAAGEVAGLPRFLGRWGPCTLATVRVPGVPLREADPARIDGAIFDRLGTVVERLHARGVALGDLHHRDVLVSDDAGVHVVDLATAWIRGRTPWSRAVFRRLCDQDRMAVARLRARFTGRDEDDAVRAVDAQAARWHRRGRALRRALDRLRGRRP